MAACVSLLLPAVRAQRDGPSGTDPVEVRVPEHTVAVVVGHDGRSVLRAFDGWLRDASGTLPFRMRVGLGLARFALGRALGGGRLDAAVGRAFPGPFAIGLVEHSGRRVPFVLAWGHRRVPDTLRGSFPGFRAEPIGRDALLIAPAVVCRVLAEQVLSSSQGVDVPAPGRLAVLFDGSRLGRLAPRGRLRNPFASLFTEPWLAAASGRVTGSLQVESNALVARFEASLAGRSVTRKLLVKGPAGSLEECGDAVAGSMVLGRRVVTWLSRVGELLKPGDAARLGGGLSIADALTGGSFIGDLLVHVDEPLRLHVLHPEPVDDGSDTGPVTVPGIVLTAPLRPSVHVRRLRDHAYRTARAFVVAASFERERRGQHPFRLQRRQLADGTPIVVAQPDEWFGPEPASLVVSQSPTLAILDDRVVLANTERAAQRFIASLSTTTEEQSAGGQEWTDGLRLRSEPLRELARANRQLLIYREIVQEGRSPEDAERRIEDLDHILGALDSLDVRLNIGRSVATLDLRLEAAR